MKNKKFLLGLALVAFFQISCGDDNDTTINTAPPTSGAPTGEVNGVPGTDEWQQISTRTTCQALGLSSEECAGDVVFNIQNNGNFTIVSGSGNVIRQGQLSQEQTTELSQRIVKVTGCNHDDDADVRCTNTRVRRSDVRVIDVVPTDGTTNASVRVFEEDLSRGRVCFRHDEDDARSINDYILILIAIYLNGATPSPSPSVSPSPSPSPSVSPSPSPSPSVSPSPSPSPSVSPSPSPSPTPTPTPSASVSATA